MSKQLHEFQLIFCRETEKAFGVKEVEDQKDLIWLPRASVECDTSDDQMVPGKIYEFIMPEWIALEKGLI
jgi:hypothetical protein